MECVLSPYKELSELGVGQDTRSVDIEDGNEGAKNRRGGSTDAACRYMTGRVSILRVDVS
jgi:hypothetical protein